MDLFIQAYEGFEALLVEDIKTLLATQVEQGHGYCLIKDASYTDAATLCFHAQGALRVGIYLGTMEDLQPSELLGAGTFAVETIKHSLSSVHSTDHAAEMGGVILEKHPQLSVNLTKPDTKIFAYAEPTTTHLAIDLVGFDLGKRPYKVTNTPHSLNGCFAYNIIRSAGYTTDQPLLDLHCHTGTLIIEAALYATGRSAFHYEHEFMGCRYAYTKDAFEAFPKEPHKHTTSIIGYADMVKTLKAAQKQAKIAGVNDTLTLSKVHIEDLDMKFDEGEVPLIVSFPPQHSQRAGNAKDIQKLYDELFYQAKYVLAKEGSLWILLKDALKEETYAAHDFSLAQTIACHQGGAPFLLSKFVRGQKNE